MHLRSHRKKTFILRLAVLIVTSILFIVSFGLNVAISLPLYYYNLDVVPVLQANSVMGTSAFMTFMNLVSLIFDPMVCAGYIFIIYLISYRKLEILAFLLWFFFLSWFLGIIKMAIHQPRPFWVPGNKIQMQSWTCYMDYGSPSGHSMLAIVLLQFLLRFYARVHHCVHKYIGFFYCLIFIVELLVMFSRVMLGMHSLNQVLFGMSIGLYSFIPYYLFVQGQIMRAILYIFANPKAAVTNILTFFLACIFFAISLLLCLLVQYNDSSYWQVISKISNCSHVKQNSGFQYACFVGTAIISAGFGVILGLSYMQRPYNLTKILSYTRLSIKFVGKVIITIIFGIIPLLIFLNPLWHQINSTPVGNALINWACANLAFFFATFMILMLSPLVGQKLGLQGYKHPSSYAEFKQFEVINMLNNENDQFIFARPRETELTVPKAAFKDQIV